MSTGGTSGQVPARLRMRGIRKSFQTVEVLHGVDFDLGVGEIHALVGENGAGKSTLVKILAGEFGPDVGTIEIDGRRVILRTPHAAQLEGVALIHQELSYVPRLSVAENLSLGQLSHDRFGRVRWPEVYRTAAVRLEPFFEGIDPHALMDSLSLGERQIVEIARAVGRDAQILVMDEPTASLTEHEVETLFAVMRRLKDRGVSIIFISHHLDEIFVIADRVTVLRDGSRVSCRVVRDTERGQIVRDMIGGEMVTFDKNRVSLDERPAVLKVEHLAVGQRVRNVSFEVHEGEVFGLYGLVGAGQELVADALVGIAQPEGGTITLLGERFRPRSPRDAITDGVGIVPSDRKADGLELRMSIGANLTLPSLPLLSRAGLLNLRRERVVARKASTDVKVKGAGIDGIVASLSGGNQQKVVLGRWLVRQVRLLVLVDPTRGVDVGAKSDIYRLIESLTDRGMAVVLVSADLPEVCSMSDRIAVFVRGDLVTIVEGSRTSQEDVLALAAGGA